MILITHIKEFDLWLFECVKKHKVIQVINAVVLLYQNIILGDVITNMCSKEMSWFSHLVQMCMNVVSYCMVTFLGYGMHAVLIFFIPFVSRHCVSRSGHITFPSKDCMLQDFVVVNHLMHAFAWSPKDIVCFGILTGEIFWRINKYTKHN